jgi:hypothetical protein
MQERGPLLDGCELAHAADDLINIHGFFQLVVEPLSPTELIVGGPFERNFDRGSLLRFYQQPTATPIGEARVVSWEPLQTDEARQALLALPTYFRDTYGLRLRTFPTPEPCRITLDRPVQIGRADFVASQSWCGRGAIVRNCHLHDGHVRGVLIKGPGALVENNRIERIARSGIVAKAEFFWLEGPFADGIRVRNNVVVDCARLTICPEDLFAGFAPIQMYASFSKRLFPPLWTAAISNRDVAITGNRVEGAPGPGIFVANTRDVTIADNTVVSPCDKPLARPQLDLTDNLDLDSGPAPSPRALDRARAPLFAIFLLAVENAALSGNRVEDAPDDLRSTVGFGPWCGAE